MEKHNFKASPIWTEDSSSPNQHVVLQKEFYLDSVPVEALAYIAVDTKYWLYINENCAVFEGGLLRESFPSCGYTDKVNIAPYLCEDKNIISVHVWYYGNDGRNSVDSGSAAFVFDCDAIGIYSDTSFKSFKHPAYYPTGKPLPSGLYGGHNIGFDANKDIPGIYFGACDKHFSPSAIVPNPLGESYIRPIPQLRRKKHSSVDYEMCKKNKYVIHLPYALWFSPLLEINADKGTVIDVRSDRYSVNGGPGDSNNVYNSQRIEYICSEGHNKFESLLCLFGEKVIIRSNASIEVLKLGYYESGYNCDISGSYTCDDILLNTLVKKAARTLYVCMRDNFMDCPDRERGQWIGDVALQAPQVFFLLCPSARKLLKKAIHDFIFLRKGDVLVGNVPGVNFSELPGQSLCAISDIGLISIYYHYTSDKEVLEWAFEPSVAYLKLWETKNGLVENRKGGWTWFDHLHNIDQPVLENAWYYSALKFARYMADELGYHSHDKWLLKRMSGIEGSFNRKFWEGSYYSSSSMVDDRANAMAVLSGLCPEENYTKIREVLVTVFCSSVYMENYVLSALCEMGFHSDAYHRMMSRYYNLTKSENSTLWEDFYILGSKNHAWSGAPANIAFKYFLGLDTKDGFDTFSVDPAPGLFKRQEAEIESLKGKCRILCEGQKVSVKKLSDYIQE